MMNEMPSHWCRLPDTVSKDIVKKTFSMSSEADSASGSAPSKLLPLLGLVDPHFLWFKRWFISTHGRAMIMSEFSKSRFLADVTSSLLLALDAMCVGNVDLLQTVSCAWSLQVLSQLLNYNNGRALFPITSTIKYSAISKSWIGECLQGNPFPTVCWK